MAGGATGFVSPLTQTIPVLSVSVTAPGALGERLPRASPTLGSLLAEQRSLSRGPQRPLLLSWVGKGKK